MVDGHTHRRRVAGRDGAENGCDGQVVRLKYRGPQAFLFDRKSGRDCTSGAILAARGPGPACPGCSPDALIASDSVILTHKRAALTHTFVRVVVQPLPAR